MMSITQKQAGALAAIVGGTGTRAWDSGGGVWLVTRERGDGRLIVFDGECVAEYARDDAFERGDDAPRVIEPFRGRNGRPEWDAGDRWVIEDARGRVLSEHDALELGWSDRDGAERRAAYLRGRGGGVWVVRER
jgi:hypothetical protein